MNIHLIGPFDASLDAINTEHSTSWVIWLQKHECFWSWTVINSLIVGNFKSFDTWLIVFFSGTLSSSNENLGSNVKISEKTRVTRGRNYNSITFVTEEGDERLKCWSITILDANVVCGCLSLEPVLLHVLSKCISEAWLSLEVSILKYIMGNLFSLTDVLKLSFKLIMHQVILLKKHVEITIWILLWVIRIFKSDFLEFSFLIILSWEKSLNTSLTKTRLRFEFILIIFLSNELILVLDISIFAFFSFFLALSIGLLFLLLSTFLEGSFLSLSTSSFTFVLFCTLCGCSFTSIGW